MIKFDGRSIEVKTNDAGEELTALLVGLKSVLPRELFLSAVVTALSADVPEVTKHKDQSENVNQILKEMERRRASKNKSAANKRKG